MCSEMLKDREWDAETSELLETQGSTLLDSNICAQAQVLNT